MDVIMRIEFHGVIISVDPAKQEFDARLIDVTDTSRDEEIATFPFDSVPKESRGLITPGVEFKWYIDGQEGNNKLVLLPAIPLTEESRERARTRWARLYGTTQHES